MATNGATPPSRNAMTAPIGRPSSYTPELADLICERLADGESLRAICSEDAMPAKSTVFKWLCENPDFSDQYARARETQADSLFDDILTIADTPVIGEKTKTHPDGSVEVQTGDMIEHRRLRVDARKWMAGKLAPKKYGEKITQEVTGANGAPLVPIINLTGRPEPSSAS
jgi:hypothetical protein